MALYTLGPVTLAQWCECIIIEMPGFELVTFWSSTLLLMAWTGLYINANWCIYIYIYMVIYVECFMVCNNKNFLVYKYMYT